MKLIQVQRNILQASVVLMSVGLISACAATKALPTTNEADLNSPRPGFVPGYLRMGSWVDSLALLPHPPKEGSAEYAADMAAYREAQQKKNSARWELAAADAELRFPKAAQAFSCALGVPINNQSAPHLTMLMRRTLADAGLATYKAKDHHVRTRPFVVNNETSCTPKEEASLRKDGSYPSGHAAIGWAWGLVLAEVAPSRTNAVMQRAYAYGQSRVVCGVHWQSDVQAGRVVAAAVVAQLHQSDDFVAQLNAARDEVATLRKAGATPTGDCAAEARTLSQ